MKKLLCVIIMMFALVCLLASCGEHTHDYGEWENVTNPTCTVDGSKVRYCTCGEEQIKPIYATGHIETTYSAVDATCTNTGLTEGKFCSACKEVTLAQTVVPALGHTEVIDEAVDATCTETGLTEGKHCSTCNEIFVAQTETAKISHTYDDKYDESCNKCGFIRDAECAHLNVTTLFAKNATCTDSGLTEGKVCDKCEEILVAQTVIDALGHKYNSVTTAANCTEQGYTTYTCSACGDSYVDNYTNALGHTESDWIIGSDATINDNGYKYKQCVICFTKISEESIPAYGLVMDTQTVNEMNAALLLEGNPTTLEEAIAALEKHGINAEHLIPVSAGYSFVWNKNTNKIELVKSTDITEDITNSYKEITVVVDSADALMSAIDNDFKYIKLGADVTVAEDINVYGANVTLDLNGHTYNTVQNPNGRSNIIYIREGGSLTVQNGTLNVRSLQNYGDLTIKSSVTINAMDITGGGCIKNKTGNVVIEGGTFNVPNFIKWDTVNKGGACAVENAGGTVLIKGGTFTSNTECYLVINLSGKMTIEGGTFQSYRGVVDCEGGSIDINGGTFTKTNEVNNGYEVYCSEGGNVLIYGGVFTTGALYGAILGAYHVTNDASLKYAIEQGFCNIILDANVTVTSVINIPANSNITIDLNGKNFSSPDVTRPFNMGNYSSLTINAYGSTVTCGMYGFVNFSSVIASLTLNGGNYAANTDNGAFLKIRPGAGTVRIILNDVEYVDSSNDGFVVNSSGFTGEFNLYANDGNYTAFSGFQMKNGTFDDVTINTQAAAFEISGNTELKNCTITASNAVVGTAPGACVAVTGKGSALVNSCTLQGDGVGLYVYYSGGSITAVDCTINNATVKAGEEWGTIIIDNTPMVNTFEDLIQSIDSGSTYIKLGADISLPYTIDIPSNSNITIDLNGNTITTAERDTNGSHHYAFNVHGTVALENGTVNARGIQIYDGGKLVVGDGVTLNSVDNNGGACFWIYGGELEINGGTFNALNGDKTLDVTAEPGIINNNGGKVTINKGTFTAESSCYAITNNSGEMIINGGTFSASRGVISANDGSVTINGGKFTVTGQKVQFGHTVYAHNATVTIKAGEFTNNGACDVYCVDGAGTGSIKVDGETLTAGQCK